MRRPLDRRMFMDPQQRRGMARMPQGILASGPRIMNAAMQQQAPVRMANGGSVQTGLGMSGFMDFLNQYVLDLETRSAAHRPRTSPLVLWILHRVQTQEVVLMLVH